MSAIFVPKIALSSHFKHVKNLKASCDSTTPHENLKRTSNVRFESLCLIYNDSSSY
jgi:hypothetical protein